MMMMMMYNVSLSFNSLSGIWKLGRMHTTIVVDSRYFDDDDDDGNDDGDAQPVYVPLKRVQNLKISWGVGSNSRRLQVR